MSGPDDASRPDQAVARLLRACQPPAGWGEEDVLRLAHDPSHLDLDELLGYAEGTLDNTGRARVEAHAALCDYCLHQLAEAGALVRAAQDEDLRRLVAVAAILVAQQVVARRREAVAFADRPEGSPEQRLTFEGDPELVGRIRHDDAGHWLLLEHPRWPPGTLVRVRLAVPDGGAAWSRYVLFRQGFEHAVASVRIDEGLPPQGDRLLEVEPVSPAGLTAEAAPLLHDSFLQARHDDPGSVIPGEGGRTSAWQTWAVRALGEPEMDPQVRAVVEEIARGE